MQPNGDPNRYSEGYVSPERRAEITRNIANNYGMGYSKSTKPDGCFSLVVGAALALTSFGGLCAMVKNNSIQSSKDKIPPLEEPVKVSKKTESKQN